VGDEVDTVEQLHREEPLLVLEEELVERDEFGCATLEARNSRLKRRGRASKR